VILLITAVANAVGTCPSDHEPVAAALHQYHTRCGAEPHHFRRAGAALVDVLTHQLGSSFTCEVADAWISACEWVGRVVLEPRHSYAA